MQNVTAHERLLPAGGGDDRCEGVKVEPPGAKGQNDELPERQRNSTRMKNLRHYE